MVTELYEAPVLEKEGADSANHPASIADAPSKEWKVPAGPRIRFPDNQDGRPSTGDLLFPLLLAAAVVSCIGTGLFARRIPPVRQVIRHSVRSIATEFRLTEPRHAAKPPEPVVAKREKAHPAAPLELPEKPVEDPTLTEAPLVEQQPEPEKKPVRKVFGLRRVYSTGLGSGGSMSDAVVGKIGNTISKEYDTVTATESDIKGVVVSSATVTTAPRFRKIVKPSYTKEMIDRKVEGTVKVKVLVDIDGKVKKATCLNDIGLESSAQAVKATLEMEFDPAMRGSDPVAVWIIIPIRFVLLG